MVNPCVFSKETRDHQVQIYILLLNDSIIFNRISSID